MLQIHPNARTTPAVRAEHASSATLTFGQRRAVEIYDRFRAPRDGPGTTDMGATPTSPHRAVIDLAALACGCRRAGTVRRGRQLRHCGWPRVRRLLALSACGQHFVRRLGASGMMIRVRKTRCRETAVLIRVSWLPERRRSVQKVLCTFPADVDRLPPELSGPGSRLSPRERRSSRSVDHASPNAGERGCPYLDGRSRPRPLSSPRPRKIARSLL
jgi:hypothetical protein